MIEVKKPNPNYNESEVKEALRIVNVIAQFIKNEGYQPGCRNNTAVDLACVCYILDIEPAAVAIAAGMDPDGWNMIDLEDRLSVINHYLSGWNNTMHGVLDKMFSDWEGMQAGEFVALAE